ncbi:MAG: TetR/AcrR family transcriptional regulator [Bacilli bacterium]|nr:TetR/AcrR family transcriptional regulator [Bacilli bacterium]
MSDAIISSVKDSSLIEKRRNQIVKASIKLFKQKGFAKTTTREIAKESGFSIGTLYEYVRTKEDVLLLVFDNINKNVFDKLKEVIDVKEPSVENLLGVIDSYYRLTDKLQEEILILYQELKSLPQEKREAVLERELEMVDMVKDAIMASVPSTIDEKEAMLIANNIFVQGHMWSFRRWTLQKQFTLDEYIDMQIEFVLRALNIDRNEVKSQ